MPEQDFQYPDFCRGLRDARKRLRLSQLDLALAAEVSQRHLSFLESGRARPGREVALRLVQALKLPLMERNALLASAGYVAQYSHSPPESPLMEPVRNAVKRMLSHHEPFPAVAMDRAYNVLQANTAFERLLAQIEPVADLWARTCDEGPRNLLKLSLHPDGLRRHMEGFSAVAAGLLQRAQREVQSFAELGTILAQVMSYDGVAAAMRHSANTAAQGPVFFEAYRLHGQRLSLFSVVSTIGAPLDVCAERLLVESFFPADYLSETLLETLAEAAVAERP